MMGMYHIDYKELRGRKQKESGVIGVGKLLTKSAVS